jgi:hypothetical protein
MISNHDASDRTGNRVVGGFVEGVVKTLKWFSDTFVQSGLSFRAQHKPNRMLKRINQEPWEQNISTIRSVSKDVSLENRSKHFCSHCWRNPRSFPARKLSSKCSDQKLNGETRRNSLLLAVQSLHTSWFMSTEHAWTDLWESVKVKNAVAQISIWSAPEAVLKSPKWCSQIESDNLLNKTIEMVDMLRSNRLSSFIHVHGNGTPWAILKQPENHSMCECWVLVGC